MKKTGVLLRFGFCFLTSLLLSCGWFNLHISWLVLVAFVPYLFLMKGIIDEGGKRGGAKFFGYSYLMFVVWNLVTTWWVYFASPAGVAAAILASSLLMSLTMRITYSLWKHGGEKIGLIAFVSNYLAFEYLFMNSEIAWPWLVLGNAFANDVQIIQWYEFVGHLGGSLWILVVNVLAFKVLCHIFAKEKVSKSLLISTLSLVLLPLCYSLIRYYTYTETENPQRVVVIQPNVDPYSEKFDDSKFDSQVDNILDIARTYADEETKYFIAPETALSGVIQEDCMSNTSSLVSVKRFMDDFPQSEFVVGATTFKVYYHAKGDKAYDGTSKTESARPIGLDDAYDIYNVSLQIDTSPLVKIYRKSRLVPGAELLPYIKVFGFLSDLMTDLGGMSGSHGRQEFPESFGNARNNIKVGVPVCYESVFGEHCAGFVRDGANMIFVITNDGWWHDTPGYRQHCSFSRLRAIENRRSIARSANTGISCIINQRGDIVESLGWWER
ncbi:MAG: apolipoprotein N-acyltransferase, partial [Bacteroidales bacterium]|nr:apolipoprotein N-acyltransferase [Bacteroidales bacterium]